MSEYFSGRVHSVLFENTAQSFFVLRVLLDGKTEPVVARGNIPGIRIKVGVWFGFEAVWDMHPQYGKQLKIEKAPIVKGEWDNDTIINILSGHGVSDVLLRLIESKFKDQFAQALSSVEDLQTISGINEFTALHINARWKSARTMFQALNFLSNFNIPKVKIDQIWRTFGDESETILSSNPWALVQIDGISFDQADEIGRKLQLPMDQDNRVQGAILYTLKSQRSQGHLYITPEILTNYIMNLIPGATPIQIATVLKKSKEQKLLVLDNKTKPGTIAVYEPWFHHLEEQCAKILVERKKQAHLEGEALEKYLARLATVGKKTKELFDAGDSLENIAGCALDEWSATSKLMLSDMQRQGAVNALTAAVSILTGLPGSGKTTTLKVVVKVLQDAGIPFLLVAPTGIAAKRLQSVTGAEASTIHRAFGAKGIEGEDDREVTYAGVVGENSVSGTDGDGSTEFWEFSESSPHPAEVVIVDESSMVDQHLLFRLLSCTSPTTRLVFVGDAAQLPSVGPGDVLHDLISCGRFPVISLKDIFRQQDTSDIVIAAHAIQDGRVPHFEVPSKDFSFMEIKDEGKVLDTLIDIATKLYEKRENFQVLSPRHNGTLGVTNLNVKIRELLNPMSPGLRELRLGSDTVREGDRIMVSKNNYKYEIFNGDVGKIVRLDHKLKEVEIKIHGPPVLHIKLPFKEAANHLRLAYCVTCHKSQGQEFNVILMPIVGSFRNQLQRNLVYTAITRAKKRVILIGHWDAFKSSVDNNKVDMRNTLFPQRIQKFAENED